MNTKNTLIILTILCLFFTTSNALAQSEDPPPKKTEEPPTETQLETPKPSEPQPSTLSPGYTSPIPPDKETTEPNSRSAFDRSVSEVDTFDIGVEADVVERHSDVAHADNVYAVAYEKDGEIVVAAVVDSGGGTYFTIYDTVSDGVYGRSSNPRIAYEAGTGIFIVTWMYDYYGTGEDYDVHSIGWNFYSGAIGEIIAVAETSDDEMYPDVACNLYDESCLVVFEYDDGGGSPDIHGRYMDITSSGVSGTSPGQFEIVNMTNATVGPYLAWADYSGTYMVVYTWTDSSGEAFPIRSELYDAWQGSGSASILQGATYCVYTGIDPWYPEGYDKYASGVAYDFNTERFVIVYTYDYWGDGSDYDIHASSVPSNTTIALAGPYNIAITTAQETSADISFITDPIPSIANSAPCKFVITYLRYDSSISNGVMAAEVEGNCDYYSPEYTTASGGEHFLVEEPFISFGSGVYAPAISGGNGSDFFVSYDYVTGGLIYQYSVLGKLFRAGLFSYLPLIIR